MVDKTTCKHLEHHFRACEHISACSFPSSRRYATLKEAEHEQMSKNRMEVEFPMYYLKHEDHNHQISKEHLKKKEGDSLAAVPHGAPSALPLQSWTQNSACGSGWRMG